MAEDEMVGEHHRLNGYEFEQTPLANRGDKHATIHGVVKSQTRLETEQ